MAKNRKKLVSDIISDIKDNISLEIEKKTFIPDIITFCESPKWLGLPYHPTNPIYLYPLQKIILKVFYRGSVGNKNLKLTEVEIETCKKLQLIDDDKGNVLGKYYNDDVFRELVLVWGRRSGKDFQVSIIALYEAMKLLECPGGDPYSLYDISSSTTINVLTIANSKDQARRAFDEIREKLIFSEYFSSKYMKEGLGASSLYLLTPKDKEDNKNFKEKGVPLKKGSIGIIVGHSNSDSLLGMGCMVLILDEVASYKTSGGASSGDRIYSALTPTVSTYCRKIYKKDENGDFVKDEHEQRVIIKRIYDGKIISISSPRAKEGKFYELYSTGKNVPNRLVCRLPTWQVNPNHTRESLRTSQASMSESEFNMEFGAEFSGIGAENFFTEEQVNLCFKGHNLQNNSMGRPGKIYFVHLDPATSSHNYALVIVHKEYYINVQTNKSEYIIVVDHIKYWTPTSSPINPNEVISYVINLKRRFHIGLLTYDQFASRESILKLRKKGIPNKETRFTQKYKNLIYREVEDLINNGRLKIPYDNLLRNEMIELQRKFTSTGFKVFPKKEGDGVKSDDVIDCVAGACYSAIESHVNKLPFAKRVYTGTEGVGSNMFWRNMQGGGYHGTGQQVTRFLERKNSWPSYRR